jgi:hypothetical protein
MLWRQHLVDAGLADGESPLFERGMADEVKPGVIIMMRHLEVESIGFKRVSLACFQACKLQYAVQSIAVVRDALRTTSNGVRQFCGFPLLLGEALKMPPSFAGKTIVTD